MRKNFPQLCAYVHVAQLSFFGGPQTLVDAGLASDATSKEEADRENRARGKSNLPWQKPDTGGLLEIGKLVGSAIVDSIPIISSFRQPVRPQKEGEQSEEEELEEEAWKAHLAMQRRELLVNIGSVVAGLGLFVGFMLQQGFVKLLTAPTGKRNAKGWEAVGADGEGEDEEVHIENSMVDRVTPGIQALANMMTLGDDVLTPHGGQAQGQGHEQ
jgi:sorting and assembly machinery component 37